MVEPDFAQLPRYGEITLLAMDLLVREGAAPYPNGDGHVRFLVTEQQADRGLRGLGWSPLANDSSPLGYVVTDELARQTILETRP
jgi:hypothetical protein